MEIGQSEDFTMTSTSATFPAVIGVLLLAVFTNTASADPGARWPGRGSPRLDGISVSIGGDGWFVSYRQRAPYPPGCWKARAHGYRRGLLRGCAVGCQRGHHHGRQKRLAHRRWQRSRLQRWQRTRYGRRPH
jgi:hypothetical protein